ncbi:MAG TPA: murein transglycosylase [Rhodospirillaceae bacterium]|nr:murein transglycosylase [Rhodospirillaceae bacterium]
MKIRFLSLVLLLSLAGCAGVEKEEKPPLVLKPAGFSDLPGWEQDDMSGGIAALKKSCERIKKSSPDKAFGPLPEAGKAVEWQGMCIDLQALDVANAEATRNFMQRHFTPYEVWAGKEREGLFTGYYEASLRGSRTRHGPYQVPLYTRPDDLVMVQLGDFREELKGQRIAGRVVDGNLKPYEDRAAIVAGNWPHNDKVMVWVDSPVDAFFVQIQGSGVVQLDDGGVMRIGYAGQNGHVYYAIGRELIARGHLTKENVSMQAIREWLTANPAEGEEVMNTNRSYVFFHELEGEGPLGGENVALTPGRSLAVDRSLIPYGVPLWVDIEEPVPGAGKLRRLMIAQDTGGAITGPVRGDVFWGYGAKAEAMAGPMKSRGRYWMLLPKNPL